MPPRDFRFIEYRVRRKDRSRKVFRIPAANEEPPRRRGRVADWLRIENNRCANCPLDPAKHWVCPAAEAACDVFDYLREQPSGEKVRLRVRMPKQTVLRECSLSVALAPLITTLMARSACPILRRYRPFLSALAPVMREGLAAREIIGGFLIAEHVQEAAGRPNTDSLARLRDWLADIDVVVQGLRARILPRCAGDAALNALIHLQVPAKSVALVLKDGDILKRLPEVEVLVPPRPPPLPKPLPPPRPLKRGPTDERLMGVHECYVRLGTLEKAGKALGLSRERVRQLLGIGRRRKLFEYSPKGKAPEIPTKDQPQA